MCDTCERHKLREPGWLEMFGLARHWSYAKYLFRHKWFVFKASWDRKFPWYVRWLCLLHDNSKMLPDEWNPYANYFYLPNGEHRTGKAADGFTYFPPDDKEFRWAWLRHIQRNKHHPQHWVAVRGAICQCPTFAAPLHIQHQYGLVDRNDVLLNDDGGARCLSCDTEISFSQMYVNVREMPMPYRMEMLADWIGAGLAQGTPDTLDWYKKRGRKHVLGFQTRQWIEEQLGCAGVA